MEITLNTASWTSNSLHVITISLVPPVALPLFLQIMIGGHVFVPPTFSFLWFDVKGQESPILEFPLSLSFLCLDLEPK